LSLLICTARIDGDQEMPLFSDPSRLREVDMHKILISNKYVCPICGYLLSYPPDDFNICPSCGVEFGYETSSRSFWDLREEWLRTGANWASRVVPKPKSWDPMLQLKNLEFSVPKIATQEISIGWSPLPWATIPLDRVCISQVG
jgi:hypothetical protein